MKTGCSRRTTTGKNYVSGGRSFSFRHFGFGDSSLEIDWGMSYRSNLWLPLTNVGIVCSECRCVHTLDFQSTKSPVFMRFGTP